MSDLTGRLIANRYRVNSPIAQGGMASVYLAEDTVLERLVALKVIHPHLASDKSFIDKFRREAKVAARLAHPNLVNVFDQGTDGEVTFLVMEYVPGITLRDALRKFGALDADRALEIIEPLTAGLAAAHTAGILHRDLKPENVFLSDDGTVKLGDFGLARAITQHTQTGSVVGTVAYLSPELVTRGIADARSDVYSLGVMMFEILTGQQPFTGDQAVQIAYQHANSRIPAPSTIKTDVPALLDEIVLWASARDASHRPENAQTLLPVISRARADLRRGATESLQEIAKTMRINLTQPVSLNQSTEVFSPIEAQAQPLTPVALKLERGNRRAGILLVLLTLVAILGGGGAGWWFGSGPGGVAAVPNLENRTEQEAIAALNALGFEAVVDTQFSGSIPQGQVIGTEPAAGQRTFKSTVIKIFLSKGPKQIAIPAFDGFNLDSYQALLESLELLVEVNYFYDPSTEGSILSSNPAVGDTVDQGTAVMLRVSAGAIPEIAGMIEAEAKSTLEAAGIVVGEVMETFDNSISQGLAIGVRVSKDPLPLGGEVKLLISKGPEIITMPNVVGETIAAAKKLLESLGLRVVVDTNQLSSNFGIAKVKKQSPKAFTQVRYGDTVTIISR